MALFVSSALAQEEPHEAPPAEDAHGAADAHADPAAGETHAETEAHGGEEHGAFPPFDPATFASQLFWLALSFGALYLLMSRVALPRIGGILEARSGRISADLTEAGRLKQETDAAVAAYEQALAEARQNAHAIAQKARDEAKAVIDADRKRIEAGLKDKLDQADARINEVKAQALAGVDAIAKDAAEAIVETLIGAGVPQADVARAVDQALAGRA
jgi:F-type H+-transporting ATPase subunit b